MRVSSRRLQAVAIGALAAAGFGAAVPAHASTPVVTLFTTQEDFTGWSNGSGSPVTSFGPSGAYDADGSTTNGIGNNSNAGGTGTAGAMQINTGANPIGFTYTVFSPNEQNNQTFMSAFDPGSTAGASSVTTVPYSGTLFLTYSQPAFTGPNNFFQIGIDLAYSGDGFFGTFFETSLANDGVIDGLQTFTATIPYTVKAGSGGGFTISPAMNAGVFGSGVNGVDNVINGPFYVDNFQVPVVPEPASLGLLGGGLMLLGRRRRKAC